MNLKHLSDQNLLSQIKSLVGKEREILTDILHHLKEVARRRLFSDLGYQSLWEYAVRELKYSEGQASRRVNAARLIQEIPAIEEKISSGNLSLSSLSLAQSYFREVKKSAPGQEITKEDKLDLLTKLENKSARQAQEILVSLNPDIAMPKEKERIITPELSEVRLPLDRRLKEKLAEVRSLLGPQAHRMNLSELILKMAEISTQALEEKRFGKKRLAQSSSFKNEASVHEDSLKRAFSLSPDTFRKARGLNPEKGEDLKIRDKSPIEALNVNDKSTGCEEGKGSDEVGISGKANLSLDLSSPQSVPLQETTSKVSSDADVTKRRGINPRYVSKALKYQIWRRDQGKCQNCGNKHNINYDHIKPVALGGQSELENLRLLCFQCNQRQSIKVFGKVRSKAY